MFIIEAKSEIGAKVKTMYYLGNSPCEGYRRQRVSPGGRGDQRGQQRRRHVRQQVRRRVRARRAEPRAEHMHGGGPVRRRCGEACLYC